MTSARVVPGLACGLACFAFVCGAVAGPVSWTGLGDGVNWSDPANWSGNVLPGAADDVTINVATNPSIHVAAVNPVIQSLSTAEAIWFTPGTTFTAGTVTSSTALSLAGGTIAGGAWTFTGAGVFRVVGSVESTLQNAMIAGEVVCADEGSRLRVGVSTRFAALRFRAGRQSVAFEPGYVLSTPIIADARSAQGTIETTADGTFTVGPTGSIQIAAGLTASITIGVPDRYTAATAVVVAGTIANAGTRTLTIDPAALAVSATGLIENTNLGTTLLGVREAAMSWTNSGTLRVTSGLMQAQDAFVNAGTIDVAGGRFLLENAWFNSGTIALSGSGRAELSGTFSTAGLGTFSRGNGGLGGTVLITGRWDNTGATYNLNATTGSFVMGIGSVITGGNIGATDGAALRVQSSRASLDGVNYGGEVVLETNGAKVSIGSGTSLGGLRVRAFGAMASFAPGYVINFPIIIDTPAIGIFGVDSIGGGELTLGPSASLVGVVAWTGTVSFGPAAQSVAVTHLFNQANITVAGAGRTVVLGGGRFTNEPDGSISIGAGATLSAAMTNGGTGIWTNDGTVTVTDATVNLSGRWSNIGTFSVTNSACNLGGTFVPADVYSLTRSGGTMNITGRLDNTGLTTILGPATGAWRLAGGTIVGGTLGGTAVERLIPTSLSGTLDSVTLTDELLMDETNAAARIVGTTTVPSIRMSSCIAALHFSDGYTISYPIISDSVCSGLHSIDSATTGATLNIGPSGSVTAGIGSRAALSIGEVRGGVAIATLNNAGFIESAASDRELRIVPSVAFFNTGLVRCVGDASTYVRNFSGNTRGFDVSEIGTWLSLGGNFTVEGSLDVGEDSVLSLSGNYSIEGTLNVDSGATATLGGQWINRGTINNFGGIVNMSGTFTLDTLGYYTNFGGIFGIAGTLENTTGLALSARTGAWRLDRGTLNGGPLTFADGFRLGFVGVCTLNNVQYPEELVLSQIGARVRMLGTSRAPSYRALRHSTGLAFEPGHVVHEDIIVDFTTGGDFRLEATADGTVTLAPESRVLTTRGWTRLGNTDASNIQGYFDCRGVIEATGYRSSFSIENGRITNYDNLTGRLSGGVWRALDGASMGFGRNIRINDAIIEFSGSSMYSIGIFYYLEENNGTLSLRGDRRVYISYDREQPVSFVNRGSLVVGGYWSGMTISNGFSPVEFVQTPSGTTRFEFESDSIYSTGSVYVAGPANLEGTVEAAFLNGPPRVCGQRMPVITARSITGRYTTATLPVVSDDKALVLLYGETDVWLSVAPRADFNGDGFLDFFDYADFAQCFEGNCPPGRDADFNRDGFVDFDDYADFVERFEVGCE